MQVVLKTGEVVTLPQSEHVSIKGLLMTVENDPEGPMAVEGRRDYLQWGDIDLVATKKLLEK